MTKFAHPLFLGHRGAGGEAPENTWPAFERAKAAGVHGFEVDVLMTRDGVAVCAHDLTLQRIAGGHGAIQSMTLAALGRLDVGSHFHPRFAGERIPKLADVLDAYGQDLVLDIEIKGLSPWSEGLEKTIVKMLWERKLVDSVIISSFNPLIIRRVKALEPAVRTGCNYLGDSIKNLRRAWFAPFVAPFSKHPQPHQVDEEYLARQHQKNVKVIPWGVNDPAEIQRLLALGVDGLISDFPERLREIMAGKPSGPPLAGQIPIR